MVYDVRSHWNDVAEAIHKRNSGSQLAGYDSLLDRYSRAKFLKIFKKIDVSNKIVMEVGSGSGLNLKVLDQARPLSIIAVDISEKMLALARLEMKDACSPCEFMHIDGHSIPLPNQSVDYAFTVTVLQHNTDVSSLDELARSISNVVRDKIFIFEDTAIREKGTPDYMLRPVKFYENIFESHGFNLISTKRINMYYTQKVLSLLNRLMGLYSKKEGESLSVLQRYFQYLFLPITITLDTIFTSKEGNTLMIFERVN